MWDVVRKACAVTHFRSCHRPPCEGCGIWRLGSSFWNSPLLVWTAAGAQWHQGAVCLSVGRGQMSGHGEGLAAAPLTVGSHLLCSLSDALETLSVGNKFTPHVLILAWNVKVETTHIRGTRDEGRSIIRDPMAFAMTAGKPEAVRIAMTAVMTASVGLCVSWHHLSTHPVNSCAGVGGTEAHRGHSWEGGALWPTPALAPSRYLSVVFPVSRSRAVPRTPRWASDLIPPARFVLCLHLPLLLWHLTKQSSSCQSVGQLTEASRTSAGSDHLTIVFCHPLVERWIQVYFQGMG